MRTHDSNTSQMLGECSTYHLNSDDSSWVGTKMDMEPTGIGHNNTYLVFRQTLTETLRSYHRVRRQLMGCPSETMNRSIDDIMMLPRN